LFAELLKNYAQFSGVAGVQPKVLAKDDGSLAGMAGAGLFSKSTISKTPAKVTFQGTTHIVKMADPGVFPAITTNEFLCLLAAKQAGLPAPAMWLANNRQCLVIERFDIKPDGTYLAFEDVCALCNMQSEEKYFASYEEAARTLSQHMAGAHIRGMRTFFESLALSICLRNGDAHLKNFGILYDSPGDAWLAPAYDIVSTTAYLKSGVLALKMRNSKKWPASKELLYFGMSECGLTRPEASESLARIVDAAETVRKTIPAHINDSATKPERKALAEMDVAWQAGIASLSQGKAKKAG
jgi:serine/threonine-protein kinase HipA